MQAVNLSIVIPCFNEETSLLQFYEESIKTLEQLNKPIEFIFVDDGSKDNTLNVRKRGLSLNYLGQKFVVFSRNKNED